MQIVSKLIGFGLKQVLGEAAGSATDFVLHHFRDHSQVLPQAVARAHERAWQALGIALAGSSFLERVKVFFADRDSKAMRAQVEVFLQSSAISFTGSPAAFRQACLVEMQQLRKQGHLSFGSMAARELAEQVEGWQRYTDLTSLVGAAHRAMTQLAAELRELAPRLAQLLAQPTPGGPPVLVAAFAYFFRREVETDDELAHGLFFDSLRQLSSFQAKAFAEVGKALSALGTHFDAVFEQLSRIEDKVDLLTDMVERLSGQIDELARKTHVVPGEVKPVQNITIQNERERSLARWLLTEVRKLPAERQNAADLLLLGDILRAAGLFAESKESYGTAIARTEDRALQAAAFYKTYLDELEQKHWEEALAALLQAAVLDGHKYAPFPLKRYRPVRIVGAGGFGTVFLCQDAFFGQREVAIKALHTDDLERSVADVFAEAHVLTQLQDPAIIGVRECSYADMDKQARPYLEMEYFAGVSLEAYLQQHGVLPPADLCPIALQVARGMKVAHERHILHRDLKPDNILIRKVADQWQVKIIDFGLALRQQTIRSSLTTGGQDLLGNSVAGTLQYAPPEQMGGLPEIRPPVPVGPYSDVYAFGKLCCQALFRNTQPLREDWNSVPELADLLEKCIHRYPAKRHQSFAPLVEALESFDRVLRAETEHRRLQEEARLRAEQQHQERERVRQQEGETRLVQLVCEALERTRGKPTEADHDACKQLVRRYQIPAERARPLIKEARERWLQANLPRQAGDLVTNALGMQFAWIPPGRFLMGTPASEAERDDDEIQHGVTLTRGVYLGVHLVTQAQWQQVMGNNPSHFQGDTRPVDSVSWYDCQDFCQQLSQLDDQPYRLPIEAEWEYACRAGTTTPFSFGETISTDQANYDGNYVYGCGTRGTYRQETTPVGSFPANAWGLYDMHGNLYEWCQDWFGSYPTEDVEDPKGPEHGTARVLRGGCWDYYPWGCRSGFRAGYVPDHRHHYGGCRVCLCLD